MKCEFLRDEHNNIWFQSARDFHYRKCANAIPNDALEDELIQEEKIKKAKLI